MAKNKLFKFTFFKCSWTKALIIGIVLGVASQYVPEIRKHTQQLSVHLKKTIEQNLTIEQLQAVLLRKKFGNVNPPL